MLDIITILWLLAVIFMCVSFAIAASEGGSMWVPAIGCLMGAILLFVWPWIDS
jgi:uncharacterized membrane protein